MDRRTRILGVSIQGSNMNYNTISAAEFCRMSGLGMTSVRALIRSGQLQSTKVGGRRLISLASAQALIAPSVGMGGGQ